MVAQIKEFSGKGKDYREKKKKTEGTLEKRALFTFALHNLPTTLLLRAWFKHGSELLLEDFFHLPYIILSF